MEHKAKGVDANGKLKMEAWIEGTVPAADSSTNIKIKVYHTNSLRWKIFKNHCFLLDGSQMCPFEFVMHRNI